MTGDPKYRILLSPVAEGDTVEWAAEVPELQGCLSYGATPEEALSNIKDAQVAWVDAASEAGWELPEEARDTTEYSGKFTLRVPKSLHRHLANMAYLESVSLNQYILHLLSSTVRDRSTFTTGELQRVERTTTTEVVKGAWSSSDFPQEMPLRSWPVAGSPAGRLPVLGDRRRS